jgi:hypothetical protein
MRFQCLRHVFTQHQSQSPAPFAKHKHARGDLNTRALYAFECIGEHGTHVTGIMRVRAHGRMPLSTVDAYGARKIHIVGNIGCG